MGAKKEKDFQNEEENEKVRESAVALRKKKHIGCGWRDAGKAFFVFCIFVAVLGCVGFGVVWLLDNEDTLRAYSDEKPPVSDVVKVAEEKAALSDGVRSDGETTVRNEETRKSVEEKSEAKTPSVNPAQLTVVALNAGGTKGSAGKIAELLKRAGYSGAHSGNASVFTTTGIAVCYADDTLKADAEAVAAVLKKNGETANVRKASTVDEKQEKIVIMVGA